MNEEKRLPIAIAGLGFGESVHLPALKSSKILKPFAIWHPRENRLNESCKNNGLIGFKEWTSLIKDKNIKGIIIATPPSVRYQLAKEALEAGKHLLLEKPVGLNEEEVQELQRLSIRRNLIVAVDFEYRAVPLFMQAKRIINEGKLGKVWLIKLDWLMSSRANQSRPWNWYSNKEEGGGVIGALGTHAFDILHWFFGPTVSISSLISTSIKNRDCSQTNKSKLVTSEDTCISQAEILDNINGSDENIIAQINLSSVTRNGRGCWIEIYGSKGTLILGSDNQKDYVHGFGLWLSQNDGPLKNITADQDLTFAKTWKDGRIAPVARIQNWWAKSITENTPMIPGLAEAALSQKVCDKVNVSAQAGLKVNFE
ncbi:Gfo/Idh/MocA family oxidoreductase [Prochlorococcus sp. MIT 1223]|uniref:Gfo/Idh/MocA family protein n=1 Tax=Prochlorococcus sp. MIT 1223 TaxID=3096217 RepID=UPI002A75273A|nr:Gfo/Idh/MocA family oxidoreductase [Prochlorococcus sp. MIT 1223]